MTTETTTRCGIVAILGAPNAGKSTLLNRIVGQKLSIVTPKPQTTRFAVRAISISGTSQIIWLDTPGVFDAAEKFEQAMVRAATDSLREADAVLLLADATRQPETLEPVLKALQYAVPSPVGGGLGRGPACSPLSLGPAMHAPLPTSPLRGEEQTQYNRPLYAALNKTDAAPKASLLALAASLSEKADFRRIFMVSALTGDGVADLAAELANAMPEGPWLYPEDQLTDLPERLLAAEITREKLFLELRQELPYSLHVETETWEEHKDGSVRIGQAIHVEREGQKKIVIGKGGAMLKHIGSAAREELSALLGRKVHLSLFVRVSERWKLDALRK